jgi:hypothetical protein
MVGMKLLFKIYLFSKKHKLLPSYPLFENLANKNEKEYNAGRHKIKKNI